MNSWTDVIKTITKDGQPLAFIQALRLKDNKGEICNPYIGDKQLDYSVLPKTFDLELIAYDDDTYGARLYKHLAKMIIKDVTVLDISKENDRTANIRYTSATNWEMINE